MYKKLEDVKLDKVQAADSGTEADCNCVCSTPVDKADEKKPDPTSATTNLSVHFDING